MLITLTSWRLKVLVNAPTSPGRSLQLRALLGPLYGMRCIKLAVKSGADVFPRDRPPHAGVGYLVAPNYTKSSG